VHVEPDVVAAHDAWLAGMHAHPHPHRAPPRPLALGQTPLRRHRGTHRLAGARERHEERVALRADLVPAMLTKRTADDPAVLFE
jgi:hypothetical protein